MPRQNERHVATQAERTLPDDLIGYVELEGLTAIQRGTLASMVSRGQIPHYRLAPRIARFSRREIVEWIAAHHIAPGTRGTGGQ